MPKQLCLWLSRSLNLLLPWLHAASTANLPQFSYCCCSISWKSCLYTAACPYGISHSLTLNCCNGNGASAQHSLCLFLSFPLSLEWHRKTFNVFLSFFLTCLCFMLFINAILLLLFLIVRPQQASVNFRKFSEIFFLFMFMQHAMYFFRVCRK